MLATSRLMSDIQPMTVPAIPAMTRFTPMYPLAIPGFLVVSWGPDERPTGPRKPVSRFEGHAYVNEEGSRRLGGYGE
jgi:hypothetical protein